MPAYKNLKSTSSKKLDPKIPGWLVELDKEARERSRNTAPREEISLEEERAFARQLQRTKKAR